MQCPAHNHLDYRPSVMHDECSMPDASPDLTSDTPPKIRRFRLRYSLRSLMLFMLLISASLALWRDWAPWRVEHVLQEPKLGLSSAAFSPDVHRHDDVEVGRGVDEAAVNV